MVKYLSLIFIRIYHYRILERKKKMEIRKNFNFTVGDIGDALAFIVSQIENEEYILEYVDYYASHWTRGNGVTISRYTQLSIVKSGYENLYFVDNQICPWMIDKVSHPITCIDGLQSWSGAVQCRKYDPYRKRKENFENEFQDESDNPLKVNPFPYLNDFIDELATLQINKELSKEEILQLAQSFVATKLKDSKESIVVLEKKREINK